MSNSATKRMLRVYTSLAGVTMFFAGMYESPAENFFDTETVEIDIERDDEDIAIVVTDLSTGHRFNADDLYTNKEFLPPAFKEALALNSKDLLKRNAGDNPFQSPGFRATVIERVFKGASKLEKKIRRSMELQASQVLQTGTVTLSDENGVALFTLDYQAKVTHFPTVGTAWGTGSEDKEADIDSLAEVIRDDGLLDPDTLIFGKDAWIEFLKDPAIIQKFETRRIDQGTISGMDMRGNGGIFRGVVEIGNFKYDCWTYGGRYKDPQTGLKVPFMDPSKVIVRAAAGRLDAVFGAIPNIGLLLGAQANNLIPELPNRVSNVEGGMDMNMNVWLPANGEQLFAGVGTRPLYIPTAIDTYGCMETNA